MADLVDKYVTIGGEAGANSGAKAASVIGAALAGGDCIDDVRVLQAARLGGCSMVCGRRQRSGWLRAFIWASVRQLDRVTRERLAPAWAAGLGPTDLTADLTIDIDSRQADVQVVLHVHAGPPNALTQLFGGPHRSQGPAAPAVGGLCRHHDDLAAWWEVLVTGVCAPAASFATIRPPGSSTRSWRPLCSPCVNFRATSAQTSDDGAGHAAVRAASRTSGRPPYREVPFIAIAPEDPDEIGDLALEAFRARYRGWLARVRDPDIEVMHRLLGGESPLQGGS